MPSTAGRATNSTQVPHDTGSYELNLLGGFDVERAGAAVHIPPAEQRLLALLAVRHRPCDRQLVAGLLFGDHHQDRAANSLRSTVHRIRRCAPDLIDAQGHRLGLQPGVSIDIRRADLAIDRILHPSGGLWSDDIDLGVLTADFLPGWYEDWVLVERERLRQRSLHALDAIATAEFRRERYARSIEVALAAVALEPLRESPQRIIVECHIAEGNVSEAVRHHDRYAALLATELGLEPTPRLSSLLPPSRA